MFTEQNTANKFSYLELTDMNECVNILIETHKYTLEDAEQKILTWFAKP